MIYFLVICYTLPVHRFSLDNPTERFGHNTLDRETKRNTQMNKFSDFSRDTFNRNLDRLADDKDSETYSSRVCDL